MRLILFSPAFNRSASAGSTPRTNTRTKASQECDGGFGDKSPDEKILCHVDRISSVLNKAPAN
jgi:hypothetical protein